MINKVLNLKNRKPDISDKNYYVTSSILIPLIKNDKGISILFEVRSKNLKQQPNEICLPGGRIEKGESELAAAIRETSEELCINPKNISIVGSSDTLITPFNYMIYTFIGILSNYNYTFNDEVKEVFTVPLPMLISQKPLCHRIDVSMKPNEGFPYHLIQNGKSYKWGKGIYPVYFYKYNNKVIWGITAKIVHDFISLLK